MIDEPLKILMVIETGGGGSGRHIIDLVTGLVARGHELHVVHSPLRAEQSFERRLFSIDGATIVSMDIRKAVGPHDVLVVRQLRRYLRDHGPFDVIHGHSSKGGALGRLAAVGSSAARIYTPHGLYTLNPVLSPMKKRIYGMIETVLARTLSDGIIAVSDKEFRHARSLGFPARNMFLVGNGVALRDPVERNQTRWRIRLRLGIADDVPVVGFVGRFCTAKAAERFVELARIVRDTGVDARFILLGSGKTAAEIDRLISAYGLARFLTVFPDESGEEFMPAFDVFTLTSRYEAMPYVLLEALAAGCPIVATDVGGSRTVIDEGENGFVVPQQDDMTVMAERLLPLLRDPGLRQRMSAASARKARDFSLDAMVDATVDVYRSVLARAQLVPTL